MFSDPGMWERAHLSTDAPRFYQSFCSDPPDLHCMMRPRNATSICSGITLEALSMDNEADDTFLRTGPDQ
jgi:hypothetical protein